ncbi:MAG: tetratricopeptide repeat protein [Ignavibacteriae bacterium]|nr:tetratricopeptide repeat protein [Ignavibacteriota bacterium]
MLIPSCSRQSAEDLYNEGIAQEEQKNFHLAIEKYKEIVKDFTREAYAESAQYRIALIYNNDLRDMGKAAQAYRKCYDLFPMSKQAPTMLFLSGFILNNELHELDSAKTVYETFLDKYPDHELAASAKFELETLSKDPNQYIKTQVASADELKTGNPKKATKP